VLYRDYMEQLHRAATASSLTQSQYGSVEELGRPWPLLKLESPGRVRLIITAGFHGEEPAGPLTCLHHLEEISAYARARDVGLTIYPCINPSGFEAGHRYNASGEQPNNDFLRYETASGVIKGELAPDEKFARWFLYDGGPKETRAVRSDLERSPTPHAAIDLHQDAWVRRPCHYAYIFGPRAPFEDLVRRTIPFAKAAVHLQVYENKLTDGCGLIVDHDGSVSDYFRRRGTRWVVTLETSTATPIDRSTQVNLLWVKQFVDFAAGEPTVTPSLPPLTP
jgi:predicted deacylase